MPPTTTAQTDSTLTSEHAPSDSNKSHLKRKHQHLRQTEIGSDCDYYEPNEETLQAIKEAEEAERTHFAHVKLYSKASDILEDLFTKARK